MSKQPPNARRPYPPRRYRAADEWVENAYTVLVGGREQRFFFITGCYKSGTNWVQNLLNLHPDVYCAGEFHFEVLQKGFEAFTSQPFYLASRPRMKKVAMDSMQDVVRRMMWARLRKKPEALWLGDRTPRKMVELLPGAPMFNVRRDGRDVLVSWNFHHLRVKSAERMWKGSRELARELLPAFKADPGEFSAGRKRGFLYDEAWFRGHARYWADQVLHDLKAAKELRARGTPVLMLSYEEMHQNTLKWRDEMYGLLGVDPAKAAGLSAETKTLPGVKDPSPTKFMRAGRVGDWRDYFDERLVRWFKEEAGEALVACGYEKGVGW